MQGYGRFPSQPIEPIESVTQQTTQLSSEPSIPTRTVMTWGLETQYPQQRFGQSQMEMLQRNTWQGSCQSYPAEQPYALLGMERPTKSYQEKSALLGLELSAKLQYKAESAEIECQKAERQMKNRENNLIARQARVDKVELSPEGIPIVRYERVELPALKSYLVDCSLESTVLYPDEPDCPCADGVLAICMNKKGESKVIYFKMATLTGKEFRRKLMQNGVNFLAPAKKSNNLAELLLQMLIQNAKKVNIPTKLGWNVHGSQVRYVKEGELWWKKVMLYVED